MQQAADHKHHRGAQAPQGAGHSAPHQGLHRLHRWGATLDIAGGGGALQATLIYGQIPKKWCVRTWAG